MLELPGNIFRQLTVYMVADPENRFPPRDPWMLPSEQGQGRLE